MKYFTNHSGQTETTVYIDGIFEHTYTSSGEEQNVFHIMDDKSRIAMVRLGDKLGDSTGEDGDDQFAIKYILEDHLGSSVCELARDGAFLEKEEYYPFGETSFASYGKKRYKYCGKEGDTESGLYYYGARYYNAWTCWFFGVDPLKDKYHYYTPYQYAGNKPVIAVDLDGLEERETQGDKIIVRGIYTISTDTLSRMKLTKPNKPGKPSKLEELENEINKIFNAIPTPPGDIESNSKTQISFEISLIEENIYKAKGGLWSEERGPINENGYSWGGRIVIGSIDDPKFNQKTNNGTKIVPAYFDPELQTIKLNPIYFDKTSPKYQGFGVSSNMSAMSAFSTNIGGELNFIGGSKAGSLAHEIGHDLGLGHMDENGINVYPEKGLMSPDPKSPTIDELKDIISPDNLKLFPKNN